MERLNRMCLSVSLVLLLAAATLAAQTSGAMLSAQGNVKVNGQYVEDSTSLFTGDEIDVPAASVVSINGSGSSVVVSPNSSVQYNESAIEIMQGTARVSTTKGMLARAGQVIVVPKTGMAKFDVVEAGGQVIVTSHEGALTVKDGNRTIAVASGGNATLALAPAGLASAVDTVPATVRKASMASEAPFYGEGVQPDQNPIPWCPNFKSCPGQRPNVSEIRPCRCKLP